MWNRRHRSSFATSRFSVRESQPHSRQGITEFRYRHIVVPTGLREADHGAVRLAFNLASLHTAIVTVLHVLPRRDRSENCYGLDAISLLHDAVDHLQSNPVANSALSTAQHRLHQFLEMALPPQLQENVNWRGICRTGNIAETIADYANAAAADLLVLSTKPPSWWLPLFHSSVRTIERRVQGDIVVVRGQTVRVAPQHRSAPLAGLMATALIRDFTIRQT